MINNNMFREPQVTTLSESDNLSLEDLSLTLEDNFEVIQSLEEEMILSMEVIDEEREFTLEELENLSLTLEDSTKGSIKSLFLPDFSTTYKIFQSLTDKLRSNKGNVKAYRKKLEDSSGKILERASKKDLKGKDFTVSLAGLLPYVARASDIKKWNSNPSAILAHLKEDNAAVAEFINTYPKAIIAELKKVEGILKGFNGTTVTDFQNQVINKIENLEHPLELVKGIQFNTTELYLARTVFLTDYDAKKLKGEGLSKLEILTKKFKMDMVNTLSPEDTMKFIEFVVPYSGLIKLVRSITTPFWKLTPTDVRELVEAQTKIIDNADDLLDASINFNTEIAATMKNIKEITSKFKEIEGNAKSEIKDVDKYITNLTTRHGKFFTKLVNRQVKLARGINMVLVRLKFFQSN